jgi:threonine/homoserine/homoserine lactone efflux protein
LITIIVGFFLTELVLSLSPGPAVMFVLNGALTSGYRSGIHRGLGILFGNIVYFGLSATAIASLIVNFPLLFHSVELAGSLYLAKIAVTSFKASGCSFETSINSKSEARASKEALKEFSKGLLLQLTNPKMIIFFVSVLPMFFHRKDTVTVNIIYLTLASLVAESIAFSVYIFVGSMIRTNQLFTKYVNMIGNMIILLIAIVAFAEASSKIIFGFVL